MKILFCQRENPQLPGALDRLGISKCYLKYLNAVSDHANVTRKVHCHTSFEIHIIQKGAQAYHINGKPIRLESGNFLLIPPGLPHQVLELEPGTQKYAVNFRMDTEEKYYDVMGALEPRQVENLQYMEKEVALHRELSPLLVENCLLELVVSVLRRAGMEEKRCLRDKEENAVLGLAKQYIADHIDCGPEVNQVADYCGISTKQLTRIFSRVDGISPGNYILSARVNRIEELLQSSELTLSQISEKLQFSSEYYFNSFFKKYAGMPPGAYRKMYEK